MDGIHDLGGMHGFGPIEVEVDAPLFKEAWQARTHVITGLARGRLGLKIDKFRHSIERLDALTYLGAGYYGRWLASLEQLLVEEGILEASELVERSRALAAGEPLTPSSATGGKIEAKRGGGGTAFREVAQQPRFEPGTAVRARNMHPSGHTRLPGYAKGKQGAVAAIYPACVFPDTNAHDLGENPQHLYSVRFSGEELWGNDAEAQSQIYLDLFESYLEPSHE